jgi:hypothetical protein
MVKTKLLIFLAIVALCSAGAVFAQTPTPTVTPTVTPTRTATVTPTVAPTATATPTAGGTYGRISVTAVALGVQTFATPVASAHTLAWAAADPTWGNAFTCTGKEVLIVLNSHATLAQTVTVKGAPDSYGRTADVTSYSMPAGAVAYFGPFPADAFRRTDGRVWIIGSDATVKFAVIRVP